MNIVHPLRNWSMVLVGLSAAVMVGCANSDKQTAKEEFFVPSSQPSLVKNILSEQAARGASADAMLRPAHFDGAKLNSLGKAKLDAMLADSEPAGSFHAYLSTGADDKMADARQKAITDYVHGQGLPANAIVVTAGDNPDAVAGASLTADRAYGEHNGSIRSEPSLLQDVKYTKTSGDSSSSDSSSSSSDAK